MGTALLAATPTDTPTVSPSPTPECANALQRSWDFSDGVQQWDFYLNLSATASGGILYLSILAADPWMSGPDQLCLDPLQHRVLRFYYRNETTDTQGSLYWRRYGEAYDESRRLDFALQPDDGQFYLYEVDLGVHAQWSGLIRQLRFDPAVAASSGGGQLDWVAWGNLSPSPTQSASPSPTATPTTSPTRSATPSATPLPTGTLTPTPTASPSASPQPSATASPGAWGARSGRPVGAVAPNPFFPGRPPLDQAQWSLEEGHGAGRLSILDLKLRVRRRISFSSASAPVWDGNDDEGQALASGSYLWLLELEGRAPQKGTVTLAR